MLAAFAFLTLPLGIGNVLRTEGRNPGATLSSCWGRTGAVGASGGTSSRLSRYVLRGYDEDVVSITRILMKKIKNTHILNRLRKYRMARGLKQWEAARLIGLADHSSLSRWELGVRLPSAMHLFRLAALYRTLVDALYIDLLRAIREEARRREAKTVRLKNRGR